MFFLYKYYKILCTSYKQCVWMCCEKELDNKDKFKKQTNNEW